MTPQEREGILKFYYSLNAGVEGGGHQEIDEQQDMDRIIDLLAQTRRAALLECKATMADFIEAWLLARITDKSITPDVHNQVGALANGIQAALTKLTQEG